MDQSHKIFKVRAKVRANCVKNEDPELLLFVNNFYNLSYMSSSSKDSFGLIDDSQGSESSGSPAGFIRSVLRTLIRRLAASNIGSFPHPHVIAKSSERLADLIDLSEKLKKTAKETSNPSVSSTASSSVATTSTSTSESKKNTLRKYSKRARFYGKVALSAAPEFIKSSILGTLLFGIYERLTSVENIILSNPIQNCMLAGMIGGLAHGSLSMIWSVARSKISTSISFSVPFKQRIFVPATYPPSILGLLSVHTVVHCSLFTAYEIGLRLSDTLIPRSNIPVNSISSSSGGSRTIDIDNDDVGSSISNMESRLVELVRVAVAGGVAGMVAETVGHYTEPVEIMGVREGMKMAIRLSRPSTRMLGQAFLPSAIGFVAYEYGKER